MAVKKKPEAALSSLIGKQVILLDNEGDLIPEIGRTVELYSVDELWIGVVLKDRKAFISAAKLGAVIEDKEKTE